MSYVVLTINLTSDDGKPLTANQIVPSDMAVLTAFSDGRMAAQLPGDDQPTAVSAWRVFDTHASALAYAAQFSS